MYKFQMQNFINLFKVDDDPFRQAEADDEQSDEGQLQAEQPDFQVVDEEMPSKYSQNYQFQIKISIQKNVQNSEIGCSRSEEWNC